jgi:hypothetical protein
MEACWNQCSLEIQQFSLESNWQLSKGRCRRKTQEPYEDLTKSTYEPKLKPYYFVTF